MKITKEDVLYVANLARLKVDAQEIDQLAEQLTGILDYMETLNQLDTTGIEPTAHAVAQVNAFREDIPRPSLAREHGLANAPEQDDQTFIVPKVVG